MDQSQNLMSEVDEDLVETAFEANQIPWLETKLNKKLHMERNYKLTRALVCNLLARFITGHISNMIKWQKNIFT